MILYILKKKQTEIIFVVYDIIHQPNIKLGILSRFVYCVSLRLHKSFLPGLEIDRWYPDFYKKCGYKSVRLGKRFRTHIVHPQLPTSRVHVCICFGNNVTPGRPEALVDAWALGLANQDIISSQTVILNLL